MVGSTNDNDTTMDPGLKPALDISPSRAHSPSVPGAHDSDEAADELRRIVSDTNLVDGGGTNGGAEGTQASPKTPKWTTTVQSPRTDRITTSSGGKTARGRNLVLLMDGTDNEYCMHNTNIVKLASVLQVDQYQLMYYDSGVGTTLPAAASTWLHVRRRIGIAMDEAFAWNFAEHVQSAYRYLMETYRDGDKIYIFGFSRGSYSARCLAGMLEKVGLLPPGCYSQIPIAYKIYADPDSADLPPALKAIYQARLRQRDGDAVPKDPKGLGSGYTETLAHGYKRTFGISRAVKVHFLGVYDTVASLGLLEIKELPFASNVDMVRFFRHALALNERRAKFQPVYRHPDVPATDERRWSFLFSPQTITKKLFKSLWYWWKGSAEESSAAEELLTKQVKEKAEGDDMCGNDKVDKEQLKSKEVWFLGCHSDVGGGNDANGQASLSNISFRWMVREAEHCGLLLDAPNLLLQPAFDIPPIEPFRRIDQLPDLLVRLRKQAFDNFIGPDRRDQVRSAVKRILPPAEIHRLVTLAAEYDTNIDQFNPRALPQESDLKRLPKESLTWPWWILEWTILQTRSYAGGAGNNRRPWRLNNFRYRKMLPGNLQKIHRSVQQKLKYDYEFQEDKTVHPWKQPVDCLPGVANWEDLREGVPPGGWED